MITKLAVPVVDPSMQGGKVLRWHKREGDAIAFGDALCELAVDEFAVLRRTARATLLARGRRGKLKNDLEQREGVYFEVVLTSSDHGVLRKILAKEGDRIALGDLLAVVTTADHGELNGSAADWGAAPDMRVVVNKKSDEEVDDFDEGE
jgi:pyruvate/2-oxoglutarate dehydrogenase complex dihydrolipoamide acyltransferase (E2) component